MPFRPTLTTRISISGINYRFSEHPAAKGMPYGQTGRRATVYQLQNGSGSHALKVFTSAFRTPQTESSAQRIGAFAALPGLQVCSRLVLTCQNHASLLQQYPDLDDAVLMPWVAGQTWQEILLARQPLTAPQSLALAQAFASILATMEQNQLAHCDLSGPNVLLTIPSSNGSGESGISLVDVEELYAPGLDQPTKLPGGSAGYAHKTAAQGLWRAEADRFAGAIILAEMLTWSDERVRRIAVGEQYFDPKEMQQGTDRFNLLKDSLQKTFGQHHAEALTAAWFSHTLNDCPRLADWVALLGNEHSTQPKSTEFSEVGRYLFDSLKTKISENNWGEAEKLVNALRALAPDFAEPAHLLEHAQKNTALENARREELTRLERELTTNRECLQTLRSEMEKFQAEISLQEKVCGELEQKIASLRGNTLPARVEPPVQTVKTPISAPPAKPPVSIIPYSGYTAAKLSIHRDFAHKPVRGQASFFTNREIVTVCEEKMVIIRNLKGENLAQQWISYNKVFCVCKNSAASQIAIGCINGDVTLWEVGNTCKYINKFQLPAHADKLIFSSDDRFLLVGTDNGLISLDLNQSKQKSIMQNWHVWDIVSSKNGQYLAVSSATGVIRLMDTRNCSTLAELNVPGSPALAFTSDSRFLCYGDSDGNVKLLNLPQLDTIMSYTQNNRYSITSLLLSKDNTMLAAGYKNGDISLWNTGSGKLLDTVGIHAEEVSSLDFHPSGQHLLSASYDGRAILWDIK